MICSFILCGYVPVFNFGWYMSFANLGKHQPPILENAKLLVKNKLPYLSEN